MKNNKARSPDTKRSKKPYQQPQLQVYGDLREVTQSTLVGKTAGQRQRAKRIKPHLKDHLRVFARRLRTDDYRQHPDRCLR